MYPFIVFFFIQHGFKEVPRIVIDVKTRVPSFVRINPTDLVQLFVQGNYAMVKDVNENIVLVLTDGKMFHIFGVSLSPESPLLPLMTVNWHIQLDERKKIIDFLADCLDKCATV